MTAVATKPGTRARGNARDARQGVPPARMGKTPPPDRATHGAANAASRAIPAAGTVGGHIHAAFLLFRPRVGGRAAELAVPDDYRPGGTLLGRQRMLRSARMNLAGLFDADPRNLCKTLGVRIRAWEKSQGLTPENTPERLAEGLEAVWTPLAIEMESRGGT